MGHRGQGAGSSHQEISAAFQALEVSWEALQGWKPSEFRDFTSGWIDRSREQGMGSEFQPKTPG